MPHVSLRKKLRKPACGRQAGHELQNLIRAAVRARRKKPQTSQKTRSSALQITTSHCKHELNSEDTQISHPSRRRRSMGHPPTPTRKAIRAQGAPFLCPFLCQGKQASRMGHPKNQRRNLGQRPTRRGRGKPLREKRYARKALPSFVPSCVRASRQAGWATRKTNSGFPRRRAGAAGRGSVWILTAWAAAQGSMIRASPVLRRN